MKTKFGRSIAKLTAGFLALVTVFTSIPMQNVAVYAAEQSVTVTYDYNWSSGASHNTYPVSSTGTVGNEYPTFPDALQYYNLTYHTGDSTLKQSVYSILDGWYLDSTKLSQSSKITKTSNHTIKANWTLGTETLPTPTRQYTVCFDQNDETGAIDQQLFSWTFDGWYSDSSYANKVGIGGATITPTVSMDLYAKWTNGTITLPQKSKNVTITYHISGQSDSSETVTDIVTDWKNVYGTSVGKPGDAYEVTGDQTLYAEWTNGVVTLPMPTKTDFDFVGWYNKPQSDNYYSNYGATRIGNAWDTAVISKPVDAYAWFNNKSYVTLEEQNRTFYEGQTLTGADLISLIQVADLESKESDTEPVVTIEKITYAGGTTVTDVDEHTVIDTGTNRIGDFIVTYKVEDVGILNDEIIDGSNSVTIFDITCKLVSNTVPRIKFKSPYVYMDSTDDSLDNDTIMAYLAGQIESITDAQDSVSNLPWWSADSTGLSSHYEIVGVSDITIDPAYEKEHPESEATISQIASIADLINLKLSNKELFESITWFSVEYDAYDQFGRYASGRVTPMGQQKGVLPTDKGIQSAEDRRVLVLISPQYDASANKEKDTKFVDQNTNLSDDTYWGNKEYGNGFLQSAVSLRDRLTNFFGNNGDQKDLIAMEYDSSYVQNTSGEDVSVHVTDYSAYAGLSDENLKDLANGTGSGSMYREIWEKASHDEKEQLATKYPDIYEDVWNAYNKLLDAKDNLDKKKDAYESIKGKLPSDYQKIWEDANDSEREELATKYPDIFGEVSKAYKDYKQAQEDYNTAKKEYEDALDRLSGTVTPTPGTDEKELTNREKWENASYAEKEKLAKDDPDTFGEVKNAYDNMIEKRNEYLDASDKYNKEHDKLSEEEQLTWDTASDEQKEELAKKYPDIYGDIKKTYDDLLEKKEAYETAKDQYYDALSKLDGDDSDDGNYSEPDTDSASDDDIFTLTFNGNGGGCSFTSKKIVYNQAYGSFPTASKTGYTFIGWYTSLNGGSKVSPSTIHKVRANVTLYARYSAGEYVITFDGNKGTGSSDVTVGTSTIFVTRDMPYGYLPEDTYRNGYTFDGWFTSADGGEQITSGTIVSIEDDQTLYAHWSPNTYTVKFNKNNGSGSTSATLSTVSTTVLFDTAYGALPTPTRDGYTFDGWYTKVTGGDKVTETTIFTAGKTQTLYAHWISKTATLYFNANTAAGSSAVVVDYPSKSISFDNVYGDLPTAKRDGYTFLGWYTGTDANAVKVTKDTRYTNASGASVTVYAHWGVKNYTIYFDGNKGSGSAVPVFGNGSSDKQSVTVTYDKQLGIIPTISRTGYVFTGWNTKADGTGETYTSTTVFRLNRNITVYAIWTEISYVRNVPTAKTLTYSRGEQELIFPATGVIGGTVYYKVTNGTNANSTQTSYSASIPRGTNAGEYTIEYYVAADGTHANSVVRSLKVTIEKAKAVIDVTSKANTLTYTGNNQTLISAAKTQDGTILYSLNGGAYSTSLPVAKNAGTYTVTYYVRGDSNHVDSNVHTVTVKIDKAIAKIISAPTDKNPVYTGSAIEIVNKGTTNDGTILYSLNGGAYGTSIPKATNAGNYTISYYVKGDDNHYDSSTVSFTAHIQKCNTWYTKAPTARSLTYNGSAQNLLNGGTSNAGTVQYSTDNANWSTTIPQKTNAGTYTVYSRIVGNSNYNDTAATSYTVTIAKAQAYYSVEPTKCDRTYNGQYQGLANAGSTVGGTLKYKLKDNQSGWVSEWVTYVPSSVGAGTYTIYYKIEGDNNYDGVGEKSFTATINKASSSVTSAPTAKGWTYDGSSHYLLNAGSVSCGNMEYSWSSNKDFSTSMPSAVNAGTYTLYYRCSGDANHNPSAVGSVSVTVNKANASVSLSSTSGSISGWGNSLTFTASAATSMSVSSSNTNIATASISGNTVTVCGGAGSGSATITVSSASTDNYNGQSASYTVTVTHDKLTYIAGGNGVRSGEYAISTYSVSTGYYTILSLHRYVNHGSYADPQFWSSGNVERSQLLRWSTPDGIIVISRYKVVGDATLSVATYTPVGSANCAVPVVGSELFRGWTQSVYNYTYTSAGASSSGSKATAEVSVPANANIFVWGLSAIVNDPQQGWGYSGKYGSYNDWNVKSFAPGRWSNYNHYTGNDTSYWWETHTYGDAGGPCPQAWIIVMTY